MSVYKDKLDKVKKGKRIRVKWYEVYSVIRSEKTDKDFYMLLQKHPRMSLDRVAYYTIKRNYSTTAVLEMRFKYGVL